MAPVGLVSGLSLLSSPEVGVISLVAFFVLGIVLLALCVNCERTTSGRSDAYERKISAPDGVAANGSNGTTRTAGVSDTETDISSSYRGHSDMPPHTLQRSKAYTQ